MRHDKGDDAGGIGHLAPHDPDQRCGLPGFAINREDGTWEGVMCPPQDFDICKSGRM